MDRNRRPPPIEVRLVGPDHSQSDAVWMWIFITAFVIIPFLTLIVSFLPERRPPEKPTPLLDYGYHDARKQRALNPPPSLFPEYPEEEKKSKKK